MSEPFKPLQERLKQQGQRLATAAVNRAKRETVTLLKEAGAELGEKLDGVFDSLLDDLNSDLRGSNESGLSRTDKR